MKRILILSLTVSLFSFTGCSIDKTTIDKAKLDAYFDTLANNNKFMGSVAISKNNDLIYSKSVGFANVEHRLKANENTKYRIGSISKTFTAVLIFKAIEENKLDLDQTIEKFFPTIKNADKITISHLLSHRSGIPGYRDWETFSKQFKTKQELLDLIIESGSESEPGTREHYSDPNFVLLTFILEEIYQKPYPEILEEKIINPLGLKNTYYGGKVNTKNNESNSYKYTNGKWEIEPETNMSILLGAGAIISTPMDLLLFSNALFNESLISANSLKQMKTSKEWICMGFLPVPYTPFYDKKGFGHGGDVDNCISLFGYFPDDNISFAFATNGINFDFQDVTAVILSAVYDKPFEIPEFGEKIK